ncbi:AMP-binding protein [Bradyrhizobium liaoningense]
MRPIDFFDRGHLLSPATPCLVEGESVVTYQDAWEHSHKIAQGLASLGLGRASKIAIYTPNAARGYECLFGVLRAGAIYVPINVRSEVDENCYIVNNLDVDCIIYHEKYADKVREMRRACPSVQHTVGMSGASAGDSADVSDWLRRPLTLHPEQPLDPFGPVSIASSGGTTGKPKGVVHSQLTWEMSVANVLTSMPPTTRPVHLVVAPMTHAAGALAFPLFAVGGTQVLMPDFDAATVLESIPKHGVTHLFLPPTAVYMLLAHPDVRRHDYSSLQYFIYAAAPMAVEKVREALDVFGFCMTQTYGQAEAGPLIGTFFSPEDHRVALATLPSRLASCGRPTIFTRIRIVDGSGATVPTGVHGEIEIGGNFQMLEYYKNPDATAEVRRDGAILTGDIGYQDADGFIYIVDRKREMIISGGFNVFPGEIEQIIFEHPSVQDCAVVGVPDEKWGEAVKAVVQLKRGAQANADEIIALCRNRLGGVKTPKSVEFWDDLPRSPVGKVVRRSVRERFWAGRARTIV